MMKRLLKIPVIGFSLILFFITLLTYMYFFTTVPEQQLNNWLLYYLPSKIGYTVEFDRISRDLWKGVKVEGISIYKTESGQRAYIGSIKSIETHYSLRDILLQDYNFSDLIIIDANLKLPLDKTAKQDTAKTAGEKSWADFKIPNMKIDNITLNNIALQLPYGSEMIDLMIPMFNGAFTADGDMVDIKVDSLIGSCPQKGFELKSFTTHISRVKDDWTIESLKFETARSNIEIDGHFGKINQPDFNLNYRLAPFDFADINPFVGLSLKGVFDTEGSIQGDYTKFSGNISGYGDLYGRLLEDFAVQYHFESKVLYLDNYNGFIFEAPVDGRGYVDFGVKPQQYGYTGKVERLNLQKIGANLYSSFTGQIDLKGRGFSEKTMRMAIDLDLSQADIDVYHFHRAKGNIEFDLTGIDFLQGFTAGYKHTDVAFSGHLDYKGEINLEGVADFQDLNDFQNQIFITDLDGVGSAVFHATGPTLDFTVDGQFASDSCRFYGLYCDSLNFGLKLKSFISHRVGEVSGYWTGGDLYSVPVDSGYFSVLVSGEKFFLENIYLENEHNKAYAHGIFDNGTIPPLLAIDTVKVIVWNDTIYNKTPLLIDVYEENVEFTDFKLYSRSSQLDMLGTVTYEGEMDLRLNAQNIYIEPLVKYFPIGYDIKGILSGDISVSGNFDKPEFETDIWIANLNANNIDLGQLNVRASYKDLMLNLSPAELYYQNTLYTLSGSLPINLSFTSTDPILPQLPIDLKLEASGNSVALAAVFVTSVRNFDADFLIDLAIGGTYGDPSVSGSFSLKNGTLYVMELVDPFTNITATGRMVNDMIYVDTILAYTQFSDDAFTRNLTDYLKAKSKDETSTGKITGFGTIKILDLGLFDYDLNLTGYGCELSADSYDAQMLADFFLTVKGSSPPTVSGWAKLNRFEFRDRFSKLATEEGEDVVVMEDSTQWDIQLDVIAANNFWIKNVESLIAAEGAADMEMSGDLTVTRQKGIYNVLGELDVIRGSFYLANMKFELNSGSMVFDQPDTLDPTVSLDVTTRLILPNQPNFTDLDLVISGRLSNLEIGTSDESAYSTEDLLYTLAAGMRASGQTANLTDNLVYLGEMLANSLGNINPIDMVDLSRETVADASGTQKTTRLTVAKYISPKLFLTYSQRLSQENAGRTVGFEYILNNNFSVEGRQGTRDEGVSFDVNLQFEY